MARCNTRWIVPKGCGQSTRKFKLAYLLRSPDVVEARELTLQYSKQDGNQVIDQNGSEENIHEPRNVHSILQPPKNPFRQTILVLGVPTIDIDASNQR